MVIFDLVPFALFQDLQSRKILSISTRNISRFVKHFHLIKVDRRLLTRFYSFSFIICISSKHTVNNATFINRNLARILFAVAFLYSYCMNMGELLFYLAVRLAKSCRDFHKLLLLKSLGIISRFEELLSVRLNRHFETRKIIF